jgi:hypothetical protein
MPTPAGLHDAGKTYHPNHPKDWDEPTSWSQDMPYYDYSYFIQPNKSTSAYPMGVKQPCPGAGLPKKGIASDIDVWCRVDEPHDHFYDYGLANATIGRIKFAKGKGVPFFIQAGFARPHAPWRVPADFWDLYTTEEIEMPLHRLPPVRKRENTLLAPLSCCFKEVDHLSRQARDKHEEIQLDEKCVFLQENMPGIAWKQNGFYRAEDPTQVRKRQFCDAI